MNDSGLNGDGISGDDNDDEHDEEDDYDDDNDDDGPAQLAKRPNSCAFLNTPQSS